MIRSLMNADVEQANREQRAAFWIAVLAVYTVAPAAFFITVPPLLVLWSIPGAFLAVVLAKQHILLFWLVWALYYLATCAALFLLSWWLIPRHVRFRR